MKRVLRWALCLFAMTLLSACTHNNGDIGPWFGQWIFESIKGPSGQLTDNPEQFNLRFQGGIAQLTQTSVENDFMTWTASWTEEDGVLTLNFYKNIEFPSAIGFGTTQTVRLKVDEINAKAMKLTLLDTDETVTYALRKNN